jgi:hypothetical protein
MSYINFENFNKTLIGDDILYSVKDYVKQFKNRFSNEIDITLLDNYFLSNLENDKFVVDENNIPEIIDFKKIIKKYNFEAGVDYVYTKEKIETFVPFISFYKKKYKLTPNSFKRVLILSGHKIYLNYFMFLESVIQNYENYQKMYLRKTVNEKTEKINELQMRLQEKAFEREFLLP